MEINIIKQDKNKIEFEILEEDHTLCNALRKKLWENKDVDVSAYRIEHPLVSEPVMLVEMKKGDPKKALFSAVEGLRKDIKEIGTCFKNVK
ncbi:MAG: DNA-directed RNA polymerase subunit L [Nanoarchaeota archaeon]|nr:DNA-directed RNA polymerase subunit L [Nanoarchaeota archaeon]